MRLTHHIALRFLTENAFVFDLIEHRNPGILKAVIDSKKIPGDYDHRIIEADEDSPEKRFAEAWNEDFPFLNSERQKAYIVTDSVEDKLGLLKVKRGAEGWFDWSVFADVRPCKKTFIMQPTAKYKHGTVLRLYLTPEKINLCYLRGIAATKEDIIDKFKSVGKALDYFCKGSIVSIVRSDNSHSSKFWGEKMEEFYEFAYKLLCFFFLSENDFEVIAPGATHGKKKEGKFKNDLPIPVTVINSRWNITSIRTDGFMVSGHFALRRCGPGRTASRMVYIEPFQKHGYIRRAGKLLND